AADDRDTLLDRLRHQPLALALPAWDSVITHAGIPPLWTLTDTLTRAAEVEQALRGPEAGAFFQALYGNTPDRVDDSLTRMTRMRFVDADGALDLASKGEADAPPAGFVPWFLHPARRATGVRILFGHWAALNGKTPAEANVVALDTGCVWGGQLTALRLEDN